MLLSPEFSLQHPLFISFDYLFVCGFVLVSSGSCRRGDPLEPPDVVLRNKLLPSVEQYTSLIAGPSSPAQALLELSIFLPVPVKYWDYKCVSPHVCILYFLLSHTSPLLEENLKK